MTRRNWPSQNIRCYPTYLPHRLSWSVQMDRWEGRYVALRNAEVPIGWSNNPALLQLETYFADHHRVNECLHPSLHFSHPRPVLTDAQSTYIFEEEGRGYFLWNDISGSVAEIKEKSRDGIISKLNDGGLAFITLSLLRTLDGPSGEPTSNIPYLPNPDFVDRAHLTENFQIPPPRSIVLYASDGYGSVVVFTVRRILYSVLMGPQENRASNPICKQSSNWVATNLGFLVMRHNKRAVWRRFISHCRHLARALTHKTQRQSKGPCPWLAAQTDGGTMADGDWRCESFWWWGIDSREQPRWAIVGAA